MEISGSALTNSNSAASLYEHNSLAASSLLTVLLFEPDLQDRANHTEFLQDLGHRIVPATNAAQALELAQSVQPDLILVNALYHEQEALHMIEDLRDIEMGWSMIICLAKEEDNTLADKALKSGADLFLSLPLKPTMLRSLCQLLQRILQTHKNLLCKSRELENINHLLENLATLDPLTQLANQACFEQVLNKEWHRALRSKDKVSLLTVNPDHFQRYNQAYGAKAGDSLLRNLAHVLYQHLPRSTDFIARTDNTTFSVILPNTNEEGALFVAEKLRQAVGVERIEHKESGCDKYVSVSIGVATADLERDHDVEALKTASDHALYQAKHNGRNCVMFAPLSLSDAD